MIKKLNYEEDIKQMRDDDLLTLYRSRGLDNALRELVNHEVERRVANYAVYNYFKARHTKFFQVECLVVPDGRREVPRGHIDPLTGQRHLWVMVPPLPDYLRTQ